MPLNEADIHRIAFEAIRGERHPREWIVAPENFIDVRDNIILPQPAEVAQVEPLGGMAKKKKQLKQERAEALREKEALAILEPIKPFAGAADLSSFIQFGGTRLAKNRILRAGFEVEGGWDTSKAHVHHLVVKDTSVFRIPGTERDQDPPKGVGMYGEIKSPPLMPIGMSGWLITHQPSHIDQTCGLHVHMSFKSSRWYSLLMDSPLLLQTLREYLRVWGVRQGLPTDHLLFQRLLGKSEYCTDKFWPDLQASASRDYDRQRRGNRYTIVNYCWSHGHETLEVRVLPMFNDVALNVSALRLVFDVTNCVLALVNNRATSREAFISEYTVDDATPLEDSVRKTI